MPAPEKGKVISQIQKAISLLSWGLPANARKKFLVTRSKNEFAPGQTTENSFDGKRFNISAAIRPGLYRISEWKDEKRKPKKVLLIAECIERNIIQRRHI